MANGSTTLKDLEAMIGSSDMNRLDRAVKGLPESEREEVYRSFLKLGGLVEKDGLTGVYNRLRFNADYKRETSRVKRAENRGKDVTLIMMDIDNFKDYNDTHGHPAGDEVLRKVAQCLDSCIRDQDSVYRYGGEEFAVLATDTTTEEGFAIGERLRAAVEELSLGTLPGVTVSVGVSNYKGTCSEPEQLVEFADQALYAAKNAGMVHRRGVVVVLVEDIVDAPIVPDVHVRHPEKDLPSPVQLLHEKVHREVEAESHLFQEIALREVFVEGVRPRIPLGDLHSCPCPGDLRDVHELAGGGTPLPAHEDWSLDVLHHDDTVHEGQDVRGDAHRGLGEPLQRDVDAVRVHGAEAAVTRREALEQDVGLIAPDLAHHDEVRPVTHRGLDEVEEGYLPGSLYPESRPGDGGDPVLVGKVNLSYFLHGDYLVARVGEARDGVEGGSLPRAGGPHDHRGVLVLHEHPEVGGRGLAQSLHHDEVHHGEGIRPELTDGEAGPRRGHLLPIRDGEPVLPR